MGLGRWRWGGREEDAGRGVRRHVASRNGGPGGRIFGKFGAEANGRIKGEVGLPESRSRRRHGGGQLACSKVAPNFTGVGPPPPSPRFSLHSRKESTDPPVRVAVLGPARPVVFFLPPTAIGDDS